MTTPDPLTSGKQHHTPMNQPPHQRKREISLSDAEELTLSTIKRMHPEWVGKNGNCPACNSLEFEMADTTRPESAEIALREIEEN